MSSCCCFEWLGGQNLKRSDLVRLAKSSGVECYKGFVANECRLVFPFGQGSSNNLPTLRTILPNGSEEGDPKTLQAGKERALIAYPYTQDIEAPVAGKFLGTPFVWQRLDGTHALVQTWTVNVNDEFKKAFEIAESNPDERKFCPQAVNEFQEAMGKLFKSVDGTFTGIRVWFCQKKTRSDDPVYVGTPSQLKAFLASDPGVLKSLNIKEVSGSNPIKVVSNTVNKKGQRGTQELTLGDIADGASKYVMYTRKGFTTFTSIKLLSQFYTEAEPLNDGDLEG